MRKTACGLLFACAAALAQAPPAQNPSALDANAEQTKALVDALSQKLANLNLVNPPGGKMVWLQNPPVAKPTVCAIPLLHVIPPGTTDKMTFVRPPVQPRENAGTVKVPAPACDAHLFTNGPLITPVPVPPIAPQPPKQ